MIRDIKIQDNKVGIMTVLVKVGVGVFMHIIEESIDFLQQSEIVDLRNCLSTTIVVEKPFFMLKIFFVTTEDFQIVI